MPHRSQHATRGRPLAFRDLLQPSVVVVAISLVVAGCGGSSVVEPSAEPSTQTSEVFGQYEDRGYSLAARYGDLAVDRPAAVLDGLEAVHRAFTAGDHPTRGLDRYPVSLSLADPRPCHAAT